MVNFKELYKYCSNILYERQKNKENKLFNEIIKNIDIKIKNGLIDNKNNIILDENKFNSNILNILKRLNTYVKPFKIIYRKKYIHEKTVFEKLFNDKQYILLISWKENYNNILYKNLYNLIKKYKKKQYIIKKTTINLNNNLNINLNNNLNINLNNNFYKLIINYKNLQKTKIKKQILLNQKLYKLFKKYKEYLIYNIFTTPRSVLSDSSDSFENLNI